MVQHRSGNRCRGAVERQVRSWLTSVTAICSCRASVISARLNPSMASTITCRRRSQHRATGSVIAVRCADDTVLVLQLRDDAERFLKDLQERLQEVRRGLRGMQGRLNE